MYLGIASDLNLGLDLDHIRMISDALKHSAARLAVVFYLPTNDYTEGTCIDLP